MKRIVLLLLVVVAGCYPYIFARESEPDHYSSTGDAPSILGAIWEGQFLGEVTMDGTASMSLGDLPIDCYGDLELEIQGELVTGTSTCVASMESLGVMAVEIWGEVNTDAGEMTGTVALSWDDGNQEDVYREEYSWSGNLSDSEGRGSFGGIYATESETFGGEVITIVFAGDFVFYR